MVFRLCAEVVEWFCGGVGVVGVVGGVVSGGLGLCYGVGMGGWGVWSEGVR